VGLTLDFLQQQDVGLTALQPARDVLLALADRIDIPGGDFHDAVPLSG
jgi:hypothetical protein